jgi:hypothetical protein
MDGVAAVGTTTKYAREDHVHPSDTARVAKAGDTMSGTLTIDSATVPTFNLKMPATDAGVSKWIEFTGWVAGNKRWSVFPGNGEHETGSNAGSNFEIGSYTDAGAALASALILTRSSSNLTIAGATATKATGTTWANPSDERIKTDIRDYPTGLDAICGLRPVTFRFKSDTKQADDVHVGLVAQEAEQVMPGIVTTAEGGLGDMQFDDFKSLDARLRELEGID